MIQTVAMAGGPTRADTLARSIADPHRRHVALTELRGDAPTTPVGKPAPQVDPSPLDVLLAEGSLDRAAQFIRSIPDPDSQCVAWIAWARHAGPAYRTEPIVAVLNQQRWTKATGLIAEYEPAVLAVLVDELLAISTSTPTSPA